MSKKDLFTGSQDDMGALKNDMEGRARRIGGAVIGGWLTLTASWERYSDFAGVFRGPLVVGSGSGVV